MPVERDELKVLIVVGLLCVVFGVVVWLPARSERAKLQTRLDAARHELGMDLRDVSSLAGLHREVVELRETASGAQRYVPKQDELDALLRSLTEAMNDFGVGEQEVVTLKVEHFAHYSVVPLRIQFRGTFPSTYGVLRRIESMPRLIRIEELKLEQADDDFGGDLAVVLRLSAFVAEAEEAGT